VGIAHWPSHSLSKAEAKKVFDQVCHHFAAGTVAHHRWWVVLERTGDQGPAKQVEFFSHFTITPLPIS